MAIGIDLHLTDATPQILVTQPATDACATGCSDPTPNLLILTLIGVTDTFTVQASEAAQAPRLLISATESLALGATDTVAILFKSTDGIPIHTTDVAVVAVVQPVLDTLAIATVDLLTIFVPLTATDTMTLGADDGNNAHAIIQVPAADNAMVGFSDPVPAVDTGTASTNPVAAADSCQLGLTDGPPPEFAAVTALDSCAIVIPNVGIYEDVSIFAFTPQQFVSVSVVDTCVVQVPTVPLGTVALSVSDACTVQAVEPTDNSHTFNCADSLRAGATEVGSQAVVADTAFLAVADALPLPANDVSSTVKAAFDVFLSVSDTLAQPSAEAVTLSADIIFLAATDSARAAITDTASAPVRLQAATDSAAVQAVEPTDAMAFPNPFDSLTVQASEPFPAIAGSFSFNVNDSLSMQETEGTPTFPLAQAVSASDSLRLVPVEGGQLIASALVASEALQVSLNDASLLLLKFLALTDNLGIPSADAASIFNSFIALAAADATAVQVSDVVSFLQQSLTQLSTTESLAAGLSDDATDVGSTQAFTDILATDAQEVVTLLKALSATDSSAYRIASEDANILNPFVVISTLSVEDAVTSDVADMTVGLPSLISFTVTDDAGLPLDDVALSESVPFPEVLDFMIPVSYTDVSDPQSYQTVPSTVW